MVDAIAPFEKKKTIYQRIHNLNDEHVFIRGITHLAQVTP